MSLTGNYTFVGRGNWSIDAVGGSATGGGDFTVKVPAGSTVVKAYLYESTFQFGGHESSSVTLTSGATSTTVSAFTSLGVPIGFLEAYRADVTNYVKSVVGSGGALDFTINASGVATDEVDGFGLVVVYSNAAEAERTILLADGFSAPGGDAFNVTFPTPVDTDVPGFQALMSLGIGFGFQNGGGTQHSTVSVNSRQLTSSAGGQDDGTATSDGPNGSLITFGGQGDNPSNPNPTAQATNARSDDELYDLGQGNSANPLPFISDGATSLNINTANPSNDDNLFFAGFNIVGSAIIDTGGNDAPFAVNDAFTISAGGSLTNAIVLGNDTDPDGDVLTVTSFFKPAGFEGTLTFNPNGSFNFNPNGFVGTQSFTYTIDDGNDNTATATVVLTVEGGDGPPDDGLPDCPTVDRAGTQNGSLPGNQTLTGPEYHNTFYFDVPANSGVDKVTNFQKTDILVTNAKLQDKNNDGIVTFGANGVLNLDAGGSGNDTVQLMGLNGAKGLRYLGEACEGVFVYADATVRPKGAIESKVSDDALTGDAGDVKSNTFFFDTALDIDLGADTISRFGGKDILVTTTKIEDSNNDGRVGFGADKVLDLPGGLGGPGDPGLSGEGGSVTIKGMSGAAVTQVEYDGMVAQGGVNYFVYSLVGSAAGVADLQF